MKRILRILFSRYTASLFIILLELACLVPSFWLTGGGEIALALATPFSIIAIVSVINRDANPEFKLTWIIVITFIPYLGTLIYVLFSRRRLSKKEMEIYRKILPKISVNDRGESAACIESLAAENPLAATKVRAILNDDFAARVCHKSKMKYYPSGEEMYIAMLDALLSAERFIFLEYFIIAQGQMWQGICDILAQKAKSGVDVRVLYDDVGSMGTVSNSFPDTMKSLGIKCERFSPITPSISAGHNNRDHRKIMIIDGKVAFTGGINIADEYINKKLRFGHWKDGGVAVMGDAVLPILELFLISWDKSSANISDWESLKATCTPVESDGGYYVPFSSGPAPIYRRPVGKNVFLNVINQAQKYVFVTTPYLIIDYDLTESLRNASLRGVDVKIITPGIPDKKLVKVMTKSSYKYLMDAGVEIYEYTPGFIHEKLLISDSEYAVIGTINFDYRSLVHHFENAVWSYRSNELPVIESSFLHTLALSHAIEPKDARLNLLEWIAKIIVRVFAPLL